jgi:NAD(P)-dependent dehydrogenase (short-subunit alcohol dehydrogenase family)
MRLQKKKALVTAAASGMGAAGTRLFSAHGARVAALDRDGAALQRLVEEVKAQGGDVRGFEVDLTDRAATLDVIREAVGWLGGIDVLWNHAGMPAPSNIEEFDYEQYERSLNLNITSAVGISGAVLPHMTAQKSGSIIFTSSTSGLVGSALSPLYSAFKSGIIGLTKGLAVRYAAQNIRVNALCPGPVSTPMLHNDFLAGDSRFDKEENLKRVVSVVPMGRMGEAIEIAYAALWLASDESSFVTGVALPVDGGQTAR